DFVVEIQEAVMTEVEHDVSGIDLLMLVVDAGTDVVRLRVTVAIERQAVNFRIHAPVRAPGLNRIRHPAPAGYSVLTIRLGIFHQPEHVPRALAQKVDRWVPCGTGRVAAEEALEIIEL